MEENQKQSAESSENPGSSTVPSDGVVVGMATPLTPEQPPVTGAFGGTKTKPPMFSRPFKIIMGVIATIVGIVGVFILLGALFINTAVKSVGHSASTANSSCYPQISNVVIDGHKPTSVHQSDPGNASCFDSVQHTSHAYYNISGSLKDVDVTVAHAYSQSHQLTTETTVEPLTNTTGNNGEFELTGIQVSFGQASKTESTYYYALYYFAKPVNCTTSANNPTCSIFNQSSGSPTVDQMTSVGIYNLQVNKVELEASDRQ
jgi:hypothetical protein